MPHESGLRADSPRTPAAAAAAGIATPAEIAERAPDAPDARHGQTRKEVLMSEDILSPYHTSAASIAAALRKIADQIEGHAGDLALATIRLEVDLQVVNHGDTTDSFRATTVDVLANAFGHGVEYNDAIGHYSSKHGQREIDGATIAIYGVMKRPKVGKR
jgi:hypothetical protein